MREFLDFRQRAASFVLRRLPERPEIEVLVILHRDEPEAGVQIPGGGALPHETIGEAAVREAREELGVDVELGAIVHEERFGGIPMRYFAARITGGELGTGLWPDHADRSEERREKSGTHEAVWVELAALPGLEVRPPALAARLLEGS